MNVNRIVIVPVTVTKLVTLTMTMTTYACDSWYYTVAQAFVIDIVTSFVDIDIYRYDFPHNCDWSCCCKTMMNMYITVPVTVTVPYDL